MLLEYSLDLILGNVRSLPNCLTIYILQQLSSPHLMDTRHTPSLMSISSVQSLISHLHLSKYQPPFPTLLFLFLCLLYESKSLSVLIKYKHLQSIAKCWIGYQVLVLIRDSLVVGNRNFLGCNKRTLLLQLKETRERCNKLQGRVVTIPLSLPSWPSP